MSPVAQWLAAVSTAVGAVFTIAAVGLAYFGLRGELRRAREERADLQRERHDREASQARLVLIRTRIALPPGRNWAFGSGTHERGDVTVLLDNQSSAPVLEAQLVRVVLQTNSRLSTCPSEPCQSWAFEPDFDPGDDPVVGAAGLQWAVVVYDDEQQRDRHVIDAGDRFLATVEFTDAAGLRWSRTGTEQPVRLLR